MTAFETIMIEIITFHK